jgi:glycerophosphoryl diester phosphodiesterase
MPPSPWPYLDHPGVLAFAHRGGGGDAPENTLPAFGAAVAMGYRYLETDTHLTADGVLVAFHDDVLDRVTNRTGRIAELPWSEVSKARIGDEPIPLLEDLLAAFPDTRVNIDPKHDAAVGPLAELLIRMDAVDRVGIGSFSDRRLAELRRRCGPRLCTSLGPRDIARLKLGARRVPVGAMPAPCAQVPVRTNGVTVTDRRFVDAAHRRGMQVHVWTIDDPVEMHRLIDLGVDGIMTDRIAVLKDVLESRGLSL